MQVVLKPELEAFIREKVESGDYADAADVIDEALRAKMGDEAEQRDRLRAAIDEGIAEADRGETVPVDFGEIAAEIERRLSARD